MGTINIPIKNNKIHIGNLRVEDVLIVPNLDRRLFSVNSFLSKGQNWVHFNKEYIELGIHEGPAIKIPITSLQSTAMVVNVSHKRTLPNSGTNKRKLDTNILHDRFHRSDGALATIKAHDLWRDTSIVQGYDSICTSCKIMTIPASARGKKRDRKSVV